MIGTSAPHFHFVIPDPHAFPSGGNLYNQFFMQALARRGAKISESRLQGLAAHLGQKEPPIFIVDTLYLDDLPGDVLSSETCYLLVHHLQSLYPPKGNTSKDWFDQHERALLRRFQGFITSSEFTAKYLTENGISQPVWSVPPALCMQVPEIKERKMEKNEPIRVVVVANLIERKGIREFLLSLRESLNEDDNLAVSIYGTDELEPEYARECKEIVMENPVLNKVIHFAGALDSNLLERVYREAHIFLSCSKMETFGMALQEAVAFRLPILAVKGGNAEWHIEEGVNGEVFDNVADLVETLLAWARDLEWLQRRLSLAFSFRPYEAHSWDDVAGDFLKGVTTYNPSGK